MKSRFSFMTVAVIGGVVALCGLRVLAASAVQDHDMNARGAMVMGFDQIKTSHHFHLYTDGGSIEVTVNDANDTANRDAIRAHLPHLAEMFGSGNFDAPMEVHAQHVPGTAK